MSSFKRQFIHSLLYIPGWHTRRKIVVIESDDWGSIRMPSREVYEELLKMGIRIDNLSYNRYDSLASEDDLVSLFEVLNSVKDKNGNPAKITANTVVANPDFDKIQASGFVDYYFEPFIETLKRYPEHTNSFKLWQQGIETSVFRPQFHGREHLNVNRWMGALKQNIGKSRLGFDHGMFDLSTNLVIGENSFMEALNFENKLELNEQKKSLADGLRLFEKIFGFRSTTFIAPCYIWSNQLNEYLCGEGIKAFQGGWFQLEPVDGMENRFNKRFHYTGQKNKYGQIFLVRNAHFEPADNLENDWVNDVLKRAELIFKWGKPLIISSHRLNYIGFIDPSNKDRNLPLLKQLLKALINKWPDIEFMSTDQLTELILSKEK